ncbi:DnaJ domain-containing protein [Artemisia annua]|uniref:DnaJ domain-containing protein n=1 Tax=Artemisia annua TaxID=35608 RepID=A0A2U1LPH9_ARTAN|nr:DnaJ domain-containing protein [Artemisia annua]
MVLEKDLVWWIKCRELGLDVETDDEFEEYDSVNKERGSFLEVLKSAFLSIFLLKTIGAEQSLNFSSLMAMLDPELDGGYKAGYMVAWVLGGKSGIVLSLCLSFASWVCGKNKQQCCCTSGCIHVGWFKSCKVCSTSTRCPSYSYLYVYQAPD